MTLKERMDWTEKKIDESCKQGEDTMNIRYWVGYLDGLMACLRDQNESEGTASANH